MMSFSYTASQNLQPGPQLSTQAAVFLQALFKSFKYFSIMPATSFLAPETLISEVPGTINENWPQLWSDFVLN